MDKWTHFCNFVGDDQGIIKQMSFWRIGDWTWQTFCYIPITDSISQLIDGVSIVFWRLWICHSVIALGGQFTWNWSKVAVNRVLLNAARAVWSPVFFTHHRPHHVSGVRGPENGSLFFRRIACVINSGSCLIPLRRSPSATAMKQKNSNVYVYRYICENKYIHTLPAKNMEYFSFQWICFILWGV